MEYLIGIGSFVLAMAIVAFLKYMRSHVDAKPIGEKHKTKHDSLGLMIKALRELGCQPKKNDDGTLCVRYQGEDFYVEFSGQYARIWDLMWAGVKDEEPNVTQLREVVNAVNFRNGPTVVLTSPDDKGVISLNSHRDIMLDSARPDRINFVKEVLDSFFKVKFEVHNQLIQNWARQIVAQKNRRPAGFSANVDTDNSEQE